MSHIVLLNSCRLLLAAATCLPVSTLAADTATWAEIGPFQAPFENLHGGSDGKNLYVVHRGEKLYGSRDGGVHWENLWKGRAHGVWDVLVDPLDSRKVWVVDDSGTLSVSKDAGHTWKSVLKLALVEGRPGAPRLRVDSANPRRLYVFYLPSVYKSEDGGESWVQFDASSEVFAGNDYCTEIVSTPGNGDLRAITYRGAEAMVIVSKDHGRTWQEEGRSSIDFSTPIGNDYSSANVRNIYSLNYSKAADLYRWSTEIPHEWLSLWPQAGSDYILAKESDAILKTPKFSGLLPSISLDGGTSWQSIRLPSGLASRSLYANANEVMVGGRRLIASTDGGNSWHVKATTTGLPSNVRSIRRDCRGLLAETDEGTYIAGTGKDWQLLDSEAVNTAAVDGGSGMLYRTRNTAVVIDGMSTPSISALEISRDCGKNWQVITLPGRSDNSDAFESVKPILDVIDGKEHWYLQVQRVRPPNPRPGPVKLELYDGGAAGGAWKLINALENIVRVYHDARLPDKWLFVGRARTPSGNLYNFIPYYSDDGGKTVNQTFSESVTDTRNVIPSDSEPGVYYADDLRTSDSGATWAKFVSAFKPYLVHPSRPMEMYSIGNDQQIYRSIDQGVSWQSLPALLDIPPGVGPMSLNLDSATDHLMVATANGIQSLDIQAMAPPANGVIQPEVQPSESGGSGGGCTVGKVGKGMDVSLLVLLGLSAFWWGKQRKQSHR